MNNSEDQNWEDHWRKEIDRYAPLPSYENWRGMNRLLKRNSPAFAQYIIEQKPIGYDPWRPIIKKGPKLGWPIWIGLVLFVIALGLWLGLTPGAIVQQEMEAIIMTQDSFPPNYVLNRYWTYDQEGNRVGKMHSDTIWRDQHVRKQGTHVVFSPGKVSDYRIDTVLHLSGRGDLQFIRHDTVFLFRGRRQGDRLSGEAPDSGYSDHGTVQKNDTLY